jgi:hypothetical protein
VVKLFGDGALASRSLVPRCPVRDGSFERDAPGWRGPRCARPKNVGQSIHHVHELALEQRREQQASIRSDFTLPWALRKWKAKWCDMPSVAFDINGDD